MQRLIKTLIILLISTNAFSQEFLDDRNMKLTEVSSDKTYGYEIKNPVKVGSKEKADGAFLNALKGPNDEQLQLVDMKFNVKNKTGLNAYTLQIVGQNKTATLYITTSEFDTPKCPFGFTFKTIDDIPKVIKYPEDSIVHVTSCNQQIDYCVDDIMLKNQVGNNLPVPDKNPSFNGGLEELKKYFIANPLKDEKTKDIVFRVYIGFVVTCEGKAGNFKTVGKGRADLETYANEVMAIVNKMPQNWQPATKDNKAVDCYQVLSFTVAGGTLDKVNYR